jgi:two-component system response regulator AtoC
VFDRAEPMSETRTAAARLNESVARPPANDTPLLIGHSPVFSQLRVDVERVAGVDAPTLLMGEPGAGRSLLARALHHASARSEEPLVVLSCRDMPETLLETELFGCLKGTAHGAPSDRAGILNLARGGTVVLEDLDEMPLRTQGLLARFLESGDEQRASPFGGVPADVRVLASTSATLRDRVAEGRFREELWSRFAGSTLAIPPLRDRREDVPPLIDHFAAVHCAALGKPAVIFAPDALQALMEFSWPGNVRELRRVVERLAGSARSLVIVAGELPVGIRPRRTSALRRERRRAVGEELFVRLITNGESFWSCVYPLFMEREITRSDVRDLVRRGLEVARGNSKTLVRLFNMPAADHKRFVGFLQKYDCQLPPRPGEYTTPFPG